MAASKHRDTRAILVGSLVVVLLCSLVAFKAFSYHVRREGNKVYIVDRTGERWEITQAVTLGFRPEGFQYGLGRHAFTPLDATFLRNPPVQVRGHLRVLGIAEAGEAQAYAIARLVGHEIANSRIGSRPIAVAY